MFTRDGSCMPIKSRDIAINQTCTPLFIKDLQMPFQKMPFYIAKGHLSHLKRASFTTQKGIFYRIKAHLLFSMYEYLLQPFLCPFLFHNKQVLLPLHYYNNTIKTTALQFSCHSCHSSICHNMLITKLLCEMLKVTATKNKN